MISLHACQTRAERGAGSPRGLGEVGCALLIFNISPVYGRHKSGWRRDLHVPDRVGCRRDLISHEGRGPPLAPRRGLARGGAGGGVLNGDGYGDDGEGVEGWGIVELGQGVEALLGKKCTPAINGTIKPSQSHLG